MAKTAYIYFLCTKDIQIPRTSYDNVFKSLAFSSCFGLLANLNNELAKMLLVPHVLVCVLQLREFEDFLIDNGVNVVGLNGAIHIFELEAGADKQTAYSAEVIEAVEERRLIFRKATDKANYACVNAVSGKSGNTTNRVRAPAVCGKTGMMDLLMTPSIATAFSD